MQARSPCGCRPWKMLLSLFLVIDVFSSSFGIRKGSASFGLVFFFVFFWFFSCCCYQRQNLIRELSAFTVCKIEIAFQNVLIMQVQIQAILFLEVGFSES